MMKYMAVSLVSVVLYAIVPAAVSAERLSYSGVGPGVSQHWFERNPSLYNVAESMFKERFGMQPDTSYYGDTVRDQAGEHRSAGEKSDTFSDQPTRDRSGISPGFSDSVNGRLSGPGLGFSGGRSSADPMVEDLSRIDGGGFSSSGNGGGSVPGYNGR
jgi:hypothetical protein